MLVNLLDNPILLASTAAITLLAASPVGRTGAQLLAAADQSFSHIPFGSKPPTRGLEIINKKHCLEWGECDYRSSNGVIHSLDQLNEIAVKSLAFRPGSSQFVTALSIGYARNKLDVINNVKKFLPEAEITCKESSVNSKLVQTNCDAMLDKEWLTLWFDHSGNITEIRLDAYHFT